MTRHTRHLVNLVTTEQDKKFEPAGQMASVVLRLIQERGHCEPDDLNAEGFAAHEVLEHWHLAHSLASVELKLMRGRE